MPPINILKPVSGRDDKYIKDELSLLPHERPCDEAMRAMFLFPAAGPLHGEGGCEVLPPGLRYRPEDVPITRVDTSRLVGVFRDKHGDLLAYARVPIAKGQVIGW